MAVQINVAANQAALTASIQAGVQAYNQRFAQNNQLNLTVNQRAFSQPLGRMTGDVKDFEAALAASNARVIAFGASTAVLGGVIRSFKELANVTIDVEKNLVDINRVFGLTTAQLQKFSTDLFSVSKQTASSFDDASKAALEFSRQGLKAEDALQRTKDALTLTRLAGISTANAVDALTSTVNGFAATGVTTTQILNKLVAVEQDYAVGAGDLAEALSRTGQAAQEAGVGLDQLNALVTAAQQSTARGGAVIGNALKTIFTRLQRNDTLDQLEAFNIAVRDVQGNILPAVTILQNFAGAYKNLADAQRAQLSEQVAGVYQVNILKAIVNDLNKSQGVYAGALQRGASATNEAEIATAKLNQTLDALLKQTATSTQQLANNIGKVTFEPLAKYGTEQLKSFVESMNEVLEGEGVGSTFANGLLKGIRNVIAGPGAIAAFFTLFKLIQNSFTYLSQALPQIAGITTETQNRKNIEQSILQIMQQQGPASQALAGMMGNQAAQAQLLLQIARQQTAEYQMQSTLAKQLAVQLAGQGVRVKGSGGLQVTRAGGYIPAATRMAEVVGAQAGGYAPGRVVSSPVGGVMNTAEDVKYVPGFAQPFINPPAGSKAGRKHRQNAISRTGIDPYMFSGFIPNFVNKKDQILLNKQIGRDFENKVGLDIGISPSFNKAIDFTSVPKIPSDPIKEYNKNFYSSQTFADAYSGTGHNAATNIGKVIRHLNLNYGNILKNQYSDDYFFDGKDLILDPNFTEIIGKGKDQQIAIATSRASSLTPDSKSVFLQGLNKKQQTKALNQKITMEFAKDKVNVDYNKFDGFIPNFAPATSAIRIPWFKKFGNASFDAVQPTLGISKAGDLDTFRQINFRSNAKGADKVGDSNIFAPLYEDFVFKALQLTSQSKIKDQLIRGYVNQPGTDQKQSAFDAFLGDVAFEKKGFPKGNLTGSISKNLNDKFERYVKANPAGAAKIKESVMVFNELGHENQITSDFGKNFTQLAGTSYSQMLKNSPDLVKELSAETNMLLNRYVKNPAFLAMSAAKGFIPNFAKELEATAGYGSSIYGELSKNKLSIESMDRGNYPIKDPASKKRSVSNILYSSIIEKAKKIIGKDKDLFITGELLPQDKGLAFPQGLSRVKLAKTAIGNLVDPKGISKKLNKEQLLKLLIDPSQQQSLRDSLLDLTTTHNNGFIPNLANFIDVDSLGKNSVHYSGDLMQLIKDIEASIGRNLSSGELRFLTNPKTNLSKLNDPKVLNRFINSERKGGFAGFANGFVPNFAYKQAVMGLEESMSGNKAIFDTKPFPHIRNSSQPTFSSAIADHGGLSNALSDSIRGQENAGLMSNGYVPNFATLDIRQSLGSGFNQLTTLQQTQFLELNRALSQLARNTNLTTQQQDALRQTIRTNARSLEASTGSTRIVNDANRALGVSLQQNANAQRTAAAQQQRQNAAASSGGTPAGRVGGADSSIFSRFSRGLSRAGTAISIAGPTIAGFAEQSFFGDRKRSEMSSNERMAQSFASTGLSAVTTGVGIGAQAAGLPGALVGGAIGGLVALKSALDSTTLSVEELKEKKEEEKNKTIENISSAERYLAIQEEISKSTSPKDIKKNLVSLRAELSSIKDADFANKIKVAGTDINSLSAIVQEYSLKQKEATSVLNDAILVQKKYSFETLKSAGLLKIKEEGGTGQVAKFMKFASGGVNSLMQFLGIGGVKEKELSKIDLRDKKTRETIYKENPNFFKSMSKIDPSLLVDISREYSGEVESSFGFGGFRTGDLTKLLKQGGLEGDELESMVATLKEAGTSGSLLGTALADGFVFAVSKFSEYEKSQVKQLDILKASAEAVANLNQQLKDFINNLDYSFKDLSRQNEFEKNLRGVRQANTMLISESLYGKRDALQTQYDFDIEDVRSGTRTKELDISKKLLTTNIQDYYNLSDAQKTAYLQLSKSFDLSKPEKNLEKIEGFIKTQFGTLDPTTATDKQKDYLTIISNVRKDIAQTEKESADDLYLAAEKFKEALMAMELSRDFVFQFKAGFRDLATEGEMLIGTIGRQLPKMFADGLVDGIKAAIRESDNLGQALMGIASKFLDEISTMMMRSSIYQIMGSFAPNLVEGFGSASAIPVPRQKGGIIRAQSGMYISGSGSGDKYPALLENGEYVLNRRAVMAMGGPASLDKLNFADAPRFASGGSFSNEFADLKSMEANMTSYGMENSKLYGELRDAEISAAEERRRKAFANKQQRAAMIGSIVAAVASIGIGAGVKNLSNNKLSAQAGALSGTQQAKDVAAMPIPKGQTFAGSEVAQFVTPKQYGQINSLMRQGYLNSAGVSTTQSYSGFKGFFTGPTPYGQAPWYQRGSMNPFAPKIGGRQTGGLIGSRLSDTIPGYMEGGLYNSPIVKRYGVGMQSGGASPISNSNSNVVNTTNATNSFNFNTNVSRDGTIEVGSNSTSYAQQDVALSKNLNSKVYAVVLDAIKNEQRFGGSLAGTRQG